MGVRGLTTYVKNHEKKFLKPHKLHDCTVLLDGNSIVANLFIWSNIESAFGGDYDKYAKYVKEFFKLLQKCEVRPYVLFDGGYEDRKIKTVYTRLRERFRTACQAQPFTGSLNFPLFMRIVFREVLVEMSIPFAQCDFEADDELAALARQLKCPVLSFDSDFYIYDTLYIPLPSLNLIPVEFKNNVGEDKRKYYVDCKIYSVDVFIESFGGLDKSMLPLLAALLGNDYIKRSVFKKFYANLKIPKGKTNYLQRRIKAVIGWLRHETFESAFHKILSRMTRNHRRFVKRQLKLIVNGYIKCESILSEYLGLDIKEKTIGDSQKSLTVDSSIVTIIDQTNVDSMEDNLEPDDEESSVNSDEEDSSEEIEECENLVDDYNEMKSDNEFQEDKETCKTVSLSNRNKTAIPLWLLELARRGKIQSCVIDILSLEQYFFPPQVEDFSLPPSHLISLQILNAIVGLLHGDNGNLVKYWTRCGSQLVSNYAEPVVTTASQQFPQLETVLRISEEKRRTLLLNIAEADLDLSILPKDWHIFMIAVVFWLKNLKQPAPSETYLHTIIMCLVGIYVVDSSIGVHRNKQTFMRKYKNYLNKVIESRNKDKLKVGSFKTVVADTNENLDLNQRLASVTNEDCVLAFETILPFHHSSEQIKMKPKLFCLSTVHAFAQFQSSLFHLMVLNSILGFPLKDCVVSKLFSGTFVYNVFQNFNKRSNIPAYVETLLKSSPNLLKIYNGLCIYLNRHLEGVSLIENPVKPRRKKRKQVKESHLEDFICCNEGIEDGEVFVDSNNRFSGLYLNES